MADTNNQGAPGGIPPPYQPPYPPPHLMGGIGPGGLPMLGMPYPPPHPGPPAAAAAAVGRKNAAKGGATATTRYKKAPDAPKRFKSAFIIFSALKHKEIKAAYAKEGRTEKTTDIAKVVSEAWRELPPDEKEIWEKQARKDKARYEVEKAMYKGPWKVPANKRTPKDPSAPKRPMSAFLAFSNKRRAALKRETPNATNSDLSKMLSVRWKEADPDTKKQYMEEEAGLRALYKVEMAKWRKTVAEEKKAERKEREAAAMLTAEARQQAIQNGADPGQLGMLPHMGPGTGDQHGAPGQQPGGPNDGSGGQGPPGMYWPGQPGGDMSNVAGGPGGQQGMPPGFNPALMGNPFATGIPGAAMQLQLSQLLAGQQFMNNPALAAQRGALGLYGPPGPGGQGGQQMAPGMAGFGSNMPDGGMGQQPGQPGGAPGAPPGGYNMQMPGGPPGDQQQQQQQQGDGMGNFQQQQGSV